MTGRVLLGDLGPGARGWTLAPVEALLRAAGYDVISLKHRTTAESIVNCAAAASVDAVGLQGLNARHPPVPLVLLGDRYPSSALDLLGAGVRAVLPINAPAEHVTSAFRGAVLVPGC